MVPLPIVWGWVLMAAVSPGQMQAEKATQWVEGGKEGLGHWGTGRHRKFCSLFPALPRSSQVSPLTLRRDPFSPQPSPTGITHGTPLYNLQ